MRKNLSYFAMLVFMSLALFISGCQPQLLPPMDSSQPENNVTEKTGTTTANTLEAAESASAEGASAEGASAEGASAEGVSAEGAKVIEKPAKRATIAKESDLIDAIVEVIEEPAEALIVTLSASTKVVSVQPNAVVVVPTQVVPTATPAQPLAYVTGNPVRIHAGPGTNYALHGIADQGTTFALVGQAADCQWYQVQHPALGTAWIASTDGNVTIYNVTCPQLPLATN